MKKVVLLIALTIVSFSCKNSEEKTTETTTGKEVISESETNNNPIYKGDFIYTADAAILQSGNVIYAVALNDMATELSKKVATVQKTDFDMVPVAVRGTLSKKTEGQEGWDDILTITEIIIIGNAPSEVDIKLEDKK